MWQKDKAANKSVDKFTAGKDRELDLQLAAFDVMGSLAHTRMLESIGLLSADDLKLIQRELKNIYREIEQDQFTISENVEDVHSHIELL